MSSDDTAGKGFDIPIKMWFQNDETFKFNAGERKQANDAHKIPQLFDLWSHPGPKKGL